MSDADKVIEAMVEVTSPGNARGHMRRVLRAALEEAGADEVAFVTPDRPSGYEVNADRASVVLRNLLDAAYPEQTDETQVGGE